MNANADLNRMIHGPAFLTIEGRNGSKYLRATRHSPLDGVRFLENTQDGIAQEFIDHPLPFTNHTGDPLVEPVHESD